MKPSLIYYVSMEDPASMNMGRWLMELGDYREKFSRNALHIYTADDDLLVFGERLHIHAEHVDKLIENETGRNFDGIIFLSTHRSASGTRALTFHPVGNFAEAQLGGEARRLSPSFPSFMTGCLLRALDLNIDGYDITFEATHHGPLVDIPAMFAEMGSDQEAWEDRSVGRMMAEILIEKPLAAGTVAAGIGGGHYCPRFRDIALKRKVIFGHMVSSHNLMHLDDGMCVELMKANHGSVFFIMHRDARNGEGLERIQSALVSSGMREMDIESAPLRK
ncbi:MAG: D-aminoacyl-tRNA deacylase [Methanomassiliicoccales archaeon]